MSIVSYETITRDILSFAVALDPRIRPASWEATIAAWEMVFKQAGDVLPDEARQAVVMHYEKGNAFPIMPGDIVSNIRKLPLNSSRGRVSNFIERWAERPYARVLEVVTGETYHPPARDMSLAPDEQLEEDRDHYRAWAMSNREKFIQVIMDLGPEAQKRFEGMKRKQ